MPRQASFMFALFASVAALAQQSAQPVASTLPLVQRIVRYDPARASQSEHVHGGPARSLSCRAWENSLSTNLIFMHRGTSSYSPDDIRICW